MTFTHFHTKSSVDLYH